LVAAYALAAYFSIYVNPEVRFWNSLDRLRDKEIAATRANDLSMPIILFTGGSSCAFSIDSAIIEKDAGRPAFNLGLPVATGARYIAHQALEKSKKGDLLVLALEPDLLTYDDELESSSGLSLALASLRRNPQSAAGGKTFGQGLGPRDFLNLLRPGPGYMATLISKLATGRSYRYDEQDLRYHGRVETQIYNPGTPASTPKKVTHITPQAKKFLTCFKSAADRKGVQVAYSMPWILTSSEIADASSKANQSIERSISEIITVIDDGHHGVATDPSLFSDSGLHLSASGSSQRSKALSAGLTTHWATMGGHRLSH
jgi:hypothetical protein